MRVCKCIHYSGRVQGVGFRFTAQNIANRFAVAGYVRNLDNGDVELVAEGDADEVANFLQAVRERMHGYIRDERETDQTPRGYAAFDIET